MTKETKLDFISASIKKDLKTKAKAKVEKAQAAHLKLANLTTDQSAMVEGKNQFAHPGHMALCRNVADGDMVAGLLLYRILGLWKLDKINRLKRMSREWIAMPRADWAMSAGLSENEMKDRALPRLRKSCSSFLEIRTMRITPTSSNVLGVSLDAELMMDFVTPWDMYWPLLNGLGVAAPVVKYLYKTA